MKRFFTKSKNFKEEYCVSIVRIGTITPIKDSDFLASTMVNGVQIVIRKDQVNEGDILFYASNESELSGKFLRANNLYDGSNWEMNSNADEVAKIKEEINKLENAGQGNSDKANDLREKVKRMYGYFNQYGRVRTIRLKKVQSFGYLFSLGELAKAYPEVDILNLEDYVGTDFDTITSDDDEVFVKAFVPRRKAAEHKTGMGRAAKRQKKVERFDRVKDSNFAYHYDTSMLARNMHRFTPDDVVTITKKVHGTSHIVGKLLVRQPKKIAFYKSLINFMCRMVRKDKKYVDYDLVYGPIYSSRSVIKNQYINKDVTAGYYSYDLWTEYGEMMYPFLDEGMTVYSEVAGYTKTGAAIQKGYDYGCKENESFIMPYRITTLNEDGTKTEWNVADVIKWTNKLIKEHGEIADRVRPMTMFHHGTFSELYPDIDREMHWSEEVLERLKKEKRFDMEMNEPLCKNKVPAEGIVIRKDNDDTAEAWKLKCTRFLCDESDRVDKGEVDIEMEAAYEQTEA